MGAFLGLLLVLMPVAPKFGEDGMRSAIDETYRMLIGGDLVGSSDRGSLEVVNPANEEVLCTVPAASPSDVDSAVSAAEGALGKWQALDIRDRAEYMRGLATALRAQGDRITELEVLNTGNTIREMRKDVEAAAQWIEFYAGLGMQITGRTIPSTSRHLHVTLREPFGVVGKIVPFNHPILFAASRISAVLITGNTLIVKPSEVTPLSALEFARIIASQVPSGVVNIVPGDGLNAGGALVRNPRVRRITFTGSVETGLAIQTEAARSGVVKHISLELGGKNPLIVFPDADLGLAVEGAIRGMNFGWQGQSCGSTSRVLLHSSIYDEFVERLASRVKRLVVADPRLESTDMGPIVSKRQYQKVERYIAAGVEDGANLVCGGDRPSGSMFAQGYWLRPTIFADVLPTMRIFGEEIFGPIVSISRWEAEDEAVELANCVEFGLTASIWTRDIGTAIRVARNVEAGYVWVNGVSTHFFGVPFGGVKQSGVGREESIEEVESYTQIKSVNFL